jgi:hypothetical protein
MPGPEPPRTLWLFSSNRRALYAQDVSNVAALPAGARYRFRYRRTWVGASARTEWEQDALQGAETLVVFSFQHEAHLHPPAFIPVRAGRVLDSEIVGSFFVVDFEIGDHTTLPPHARGNDDLPSLGKRVQSFTRAAEEILKEGHPGGDPDRSAVFGPPPTAHVENNPPLGEAWERIVEQLAASGAYPNHLFFRVGAFSEVGGADLAMSQGQYNLTAGKTYEVQLAHYQPEPFSARRQLSIVVDDHAISVHGGKSVAVTSGYDSVRIRFHASYRDEPVDTTMTIEPGPTEEGSRVVLPMRISPPKSEKAFRVGLGTSAVLLAAVPGAWKDFSGDALPAALGLIVAGGLGTAWLSARSRIRLPKKGSG